MSRLYSACELRTVALAVQFTTDQKIAEFNITETVTTRLLGWVKLLGSVLGLLLVAAGFLGIKGLLDLQHDAEIVVKSEADQLKKSIAGEEQRISEEQQRLNNLISEDSKIHERFAALLFVYWTLEAPHLGASDR